MPSRSEKPGTVEIPGLHKHTAFRGYWGEKALKPGGEALLLDEGLPDLPPSDEYFRIQQEVSQSTQRADLVRRYGEFDTIPLKEAILSRFGKYGLGRNFEVFLNGGGSIRSLQMVVHMLPFPPEKSRIYALQPSFPAVENYVLHLGNGDAQSPMRFIPVGGDPNSSFDQDIDRLIEMRRKGKAKGATLVFLAQPRAGRGDEVSRDRIEQVLQTFNNPADIALISETAADFLDEEASAIPLLSSYDNLVIAKGLGKLHGDPQDRIGLLLMSKKIAQHWNGIRRIVDVYSPSVDQYLLSIRLLDPDVIRRRLEGPQGIKQKIRDVKKPLIEALTAGGITVLRSDKNDTVPFMVIRIGRTETLGRLKVAAAPGLGFGIEPEVSEIYVRISVPSSVDKITAIVERMQEASGIEPGSIVPQVPEGWGEVPYEMTPEERARLI